MSENTTQSTTNPKATRRNMIRGAATVAAAGAVAGTAAATRAAAQTSAPVKKVIRKGPKPATPPLFNSTIQFGYLIFIAGVGYHEGNDIKVHTDGVLKQIQKQLEDAGSSMEKVLKATVFLADLKDYAAMNDVFRGRFGDEPPVRTTVAVTALPGTSLIEIDVIAYV